MNNALRSTETTSFTRKRTILTWFKSPYDGKKNQNGEILVYFRYDFINYETFKDVKFDA